MPYLRVSRHQSSMISYISLVCLVFSVAHAAHVAHTRIHVPPHELRSDGTNNADVKYAIEKLTKAEKDLKNTLSLISEADKGK